MGKFQLITKGLIKENPTFVLLLGMCPTLATTTSAINGMSMGLATLFVLVLSNMAISLIAPYIPDKVRIPSYIVVIATFVTLLQFVMQAYVPDIYETYGHRHSGSCAQLVGYAQERTYAEELREQDIVYEYR